ncbi:MAG: hypothetical protein WCS94_14850 [Verrucomicrobiota bacterium]
MNKKILLVLAVIAVAASVALVKWKTSTPTPPAETPVLTTPVDRGSVSSKEVPSARVAPTEPAASPIAANPSTANISATVKQADQTVPVNRLAAPTPTPVAQEKAVSGIPKIVGEDINASYPAEVPGLMVLAQMTVNDQSYNLTPDQVGVFSKITIQPQQKVAVTATWPEGQSGQRVVAAVMDGGQLNAGQRVVGLDLDNQRRAAFEFTAGQTPGIYRITLRSGADVKTLQLWVADPA